MFIKRWFFSLCLFLCLVYASGEEISTGRDVRTVYVGQEFTIAINLLDKDKYPDYWYDTVDPLLNTQYVQYIKKESIAKTAGLDPKPMKNIYYFKAIKRGETNINIYRKKVGEKSTTGLEYSILIKIEK